ncbi:unnamed protein product [Pleuronectes platessa]|uniref:Uncharacterized protein n=1 Tax=Pleuronectes platessa TaxID=8262 RepID=A0A9N7Z608_PLEPL|nr:unnamed protein product [Pleuronectes platessa]
MVLKCSGTENITSLLLSWYSPNCNPSPDLSTSQPATGRSTTSCYQRCAMRRSGCVHDRDSSEPPPLLGRGSGPEVGKLPALGARLNPPHQWPYVDRRLPPRTPTDGGRTRQNGSDI